MSWSQIGNDDCGYVVVVVVGYDGQHWLAFAIQLAPFTKFFTVSVAYAHFLLANNRAFLADNC